MPVAHISQQDEADFMQMLLGGLDQTLSSAPPTTPTKSRKPHRIERVYHSPAKNMTHHDKEETPLLATDTNAKHTTPDMDVNMETLLEGAESWDWDDMLSPVKNKKVESPKKLRTKPGEKHREHISQIGKGEYKKEICTRCSVESVCESEVNGRAQKKLVVRVEPGVERRSVVLEDDWVYTEVYVGDIVNTIGPYEPLNPSSSSLTSTIRITSKSNYLILHPDTLITATSLSNASQCVRKPLIASLVRTPSSEVTPALVWGTVLHEVIQACFSENKWEETWMEEKIKEVVKAKMMYVVRIEMTVEEVIREVMARAKGLIVFAKKYLSAEPKPEGVLQDTRSGPNDPQSLLAITDLLDVEEDIWSPTYGLKGKIDATVHAVVSHPQSPSKIQPYFPKPNSPSSNSRVLTGPKPFEIKTGRSIAGMEHRAQTMLYALLVAERYHQDVDAGLLYYTQKEEVVRVPVVRNELRGLVMARNEMAMYIMRRGRGRRAGEDGKGNGAVDREEPFLPPTIDDERLCKRCYVLDTCMLYRRAVENVEDTSSPISSVYDLKTSHLSQTQLDFFKKWEKLIALDEQDVHRFKKELWTMGAKEREMRGRCFAMMVMDGTFGGSKNEGGIMQLSKGHRRTNSKLNASPSISAGYFEDGTDGYGGDGTDPTTEMMNAGKEGIHKYTYRFVRSPDKASSQGGKMEFESLLNGHMGIGEAITVSVEPDLLALARGFILDLTPRAVVLGVDHELSLDTIRWRMGMGVGKRRDEGQQQGQGQVLFRIDKDDLYGGFARIRNNLAQMFFAEGDKKRLELVVDLREPVFEMKDPNEQQDNKSMLDQYESHTRLLNSHQKVAIQKVLNAKDYALILGMPGTGKTSVIASLVKILVGMGKTVLLSAYTHSAVDNILLRMGDVGFRILRLGNLDKIHSDVQKYTLANKRQATTMEQLEMQLMSPPVVATTCLSVDHVLFSRRKFDYCIVDEASQITLPTCLGPIRFADTFILVGDHFQLPPLVRSREARKGGLDISLFRRLSDAHPKAVVELAHQYRMNEDIMTLSNRLIYGERLRCGSDEVKKRSLILPKKTFLEGLCMHGCAGGCWMRRLMDESCKAVFVDTDDIPARESHAGDLIQNEIEAELVRQVTETLLKSGISPEQIGIITLYRQQVKLISHLLGGRKDVEILTADRSQGRDKDCIIFSMVRSNDENKTGDLMRDWRRMNVSFTRARSKLIIFGSRKTLEATPLLSEFFRLMDEKKWVLKMPPGGHVLHTEVFGTPSILTPGAMSTTPFARPRDENGSTKTTPCKRSAENGEKENLCASDGKHKPMGDDRPLKKIRKSFDAKALRSNPLLQDLINEGF